MILLKENFQKLIEYTLLYNENNFAAENFYQIRNEVELIGGIVADYIEELITEKFPDNDNLWQFIHQAKLLGVLDVKKLRMENTEYNDMSLPDNYILQFSLFFYKNRKENKPPLFEIDWFFYDNGSKKSKITYSTNRQSAETNLWARTIDIFVKENFSVI